MQLDEIGKHILNTLIPKPVLFFTELPTCFRFAGVYAEAMMIGLRCAAYHQMWIQHLPSPRLLGSFLSQLARDFPAAAGGPPPPKGAQGGPHAHCRHCFFL